MTRLDKMPAADLTDTQLTTEIARLEKQWADLRAALEECGGASGSPGEWLWERMGELDSERKRRGVPASEGPGS